MEGGQVLLVEDYARQGVGQHGFEAVADLDPHLALIGRDDKQRAVVLVLLPDRPCAAELIAVILDRIALQVGNGRDNQLAAGRFFQLFKLCGKRSEEHTSELQSLMRNSYAVLCLKKKN